MLKKGYFFDFLIIFVPYHQGIRKILYETKANTVNIKLKKNNNFLFNKTHYEKNYNDVGAVGNRVAERRRL